MRMRLRLGRIAGIAVDVSWTVLLIVWLLAWSLASYTLPEWAPRHSAVAYWTVGVLAALGLMASVLAHELSHALVANRHGVHVEEITLWMFGGVARLGEQARDASTELKIALAGPAMSFAIGAACLAVAASGAVLGAPSLLVAAVAWAGVVNVVLAVFNLLPGAPLDGGRVLGAILWLRSGDEQLARKRAARSGQLVGQVLIALGVVELLLGFGVGGIWLALIGWYLMSAARAEEAHIDLLSTFEGVHVGDVMSTDVQSLDGDRTVADFVHHEAATARVSSFPVVDRDGALLGLVTLRRLRQLPPSEWSTTTLRAIAIPVDQLAVARPDEMLVDVLGRARTSSGRVIVADGRRLVGMVTPGDVATAIERLSLTHPRGGPSTPPARSALR